MPFNAAPTEQETRATRALGSLGLTIHHKVIELNGRPAHEDNSVMLKSYVGRVPRGATNKRRHWALADLTIGMRPQFVIDFLANQEADTVVQYWLREDEKIVISFVSDTRRKRLKRIMRHRQITLLLPMSTLEYDITLELERNVAQL